MLIMIFAAKVGIPYENDKQYWAEVTRIHKMCGPARRAFFEKYPDWQQADFSY